MFSGQNLWVATPLATSAAKWPVASLRGDGAERKRSNAAQKGTEAAIVVGTTSGYRVVIPAKAGIQYCLESGFPRRP